MDSIDSLDDGPKSERCSLGLISPLNSMCPFGMMCPFSSVCPIDNDHHIHKKHLVIGFTGPNKMGPVYPVNKFNGHIVSVWPSGHGWTSLKSYKKSNGLSSGRQMNIEYDSPMDKHHITSDGFTPVCIHYTQRTIDLII